MDRMKIDKVLSILTLIISTIAIILSQFHPLYTYLDKPKIEMHVAKRTSFYDGWGNLGTNIFIQLTNSGNVSGIVKKIDIYLERQGSIYKKILVAQSYYLKPSTVGKDATVSQIPFSNIAIKPNEIWGTFVNAYAEFTKSQQKTISDLTLGVEENINSKLSDAAPSDEVVINDDLLAKIIDFTRSNLDGLEIGEYNMLVLCWVGSEKQPSIRQGFSFPIYDSDISKLKGKEKAYRYGMGIIYPIPHYQQVNFTSTLNEIVSSERLAKLYQSYSSL